MACEGEVLVNKRGNLLCFTSSVFILLFCIFVTNFFMSISIFSYSKVSLLVI